MERFLGKLLLLRFIWRISETDIEIFSDDVQMNYSKLGEH